MLNCTVKLEIVFRTILKTGAIAVPKNKINVLTDKRSLGYHSRLTLL